jgi:hypothetical protein
MNPSAHVGNSEKLTAGLQFYIYSYAITPTLFIYFINSFIALLGKYVS